MRSNDELLLYADLHIEYQLKGIVYDFYVHKEKHLNLLIMPDRSINLYIPFIYGGMPIGIRLHDNT